MRFCRGVVVPLSSRGLVVRILPVPSNCTSRSHHCSKLLFWRHQKTVLLQSSTVIVTAFRVIIAYNDTFCTSQKPSFWTGAKQAPKDFPPPGPHCTQLQQGGWEAFEEHARC